MKKRLFGKHWYWYWLIIFISIIAACFIISIYSGYCFFSTILKVVEDWSAFLSAAAAGILAIVAFLAIRNANLQEALRRKHDLDKESRELKERLLNKIIEWAEDIKGASVTPDIAPSQRVEREQNVLMRYGTSLSRAISIETIISERFQKELFDDFSKIIDALMKFMCIKQYMLNRTFPPEEAMSKQVTDKVKNDINKKPIEDLFIEYATELTNLVNGLLRKTNKIKIAS